MSVNFLYISKGVKKVRKGLQFLIPDSKKLSQTRLIDGTYLHPWITQSRRINTEALRIIWAGIPED